MIGSHIIPRFYLEQFATPSLKRGKDKPGRIWVYERGREPDERATSVQGKENGYFGYYKEDGTLEESFETILSDRENECNDTLVCAKFDTFHWPHGAEEKIAFYAALLHSRATQKSRHSATLQSTMMTQFREAISGGGSLVKEIAESVAAELKQDAPEEIVRKAMVQFIEKTDTPEEARNVFLNRLLINTKSIADLLLKKRPWRIIRPPSGAEFVTTDNPLISFVPLGNGLLHTGYGFGRETVDAAFPLAPDACLLMGKAWPVKGHLQKEHSARLNEALITISDKYVYAKTKSDEVNALVQKCAGDSRYGVNAFVPVGLAVPTAESFLRTFFGLDPNPEAK